MEYDKSAAMSGNCKLNTMIGIASLMHFLVDGLCICALYLMVNNFCIADAFAVFMTYNVLAFMTQPFTGIWVDKLRNKHLVLLVSCISFALAVLMTALVVALPQLQVSLTAVMSVSVLLGMGNSMFHVWGGKQTVIKKGNDMRHIGVFVSTGALGLAVGFVLCSWALLYIFLLSICVLGFIFVKMELDMKFAQMTEVKGSESDGNDPESPSWGKAVVCLAIIAIASFVLFRSFVGESISSGIHKNNLLLILFAAVAMVGKMAGGWIARYSGIVWSTAIFILGAMTCYFLKSEGMTTVLIGLFLINCTMPVTLYLANCLLKEREGLAFGILAAALIPGYLLANFL